MFVVFIKLLEKLKIKLKQKIYIHNIDKLSQIIKRAIYWHLVVFFNCGYISASQN